MVLTNPQQSNYRTRQGYRARASMKGGELMDKKKVLSLEDVEQAVYQFVGEALKDEETKNSPEMVAALAGLLQAIVVE